jgi:hypothetical protein
MRHDEAPLLGEGATARGVLITGSCHGPGGDNPYMGG